MNLKEPTLLLSLPVQVPTGGFSIIWMMSPFCALNKMSVWTMKVFHTLFHKNIFTNYMALINIPAVWEIPYHTGWGWSQCGPELFHRKALCRCCPLVSYCLSDWSHCPDFVCQHLHNTNKIKSAYLLITASYRAGVRLPAQAYIQRAGVIEGGVLCPLSCWSKQMFCFQRWDLASSRMETWGTSSHLLHSQSGIHITKEDHFSRITLWYI